MLRYARLYLHFLRFSFTKAMQFRLDFFFRVVMDCAFYATNIAFFRVVHRHTDQIAGWNVEDTYVFVCSYLWLDAAHMTVFSNNMWWFPHFVNKGELDYYLVRPASPLFFVTLREFAANSLLNLIIATALVLHAMTTHPQSFSVLESLGFFLLLAFGVLLNATLHLLVLLPVFWAQSGESFRQLYYSLGLFAERPHRVYPNWLQRVLTTILPFALVASYPTSLLLDGFDERVFAQLLGVSFAFFVLLGVLWRRALRAYASASS